jgi:hypothetical protein
MAPPLSRAKLFRALSLLSTAIIAVQAQAEAQSPVSNNYTSKLTPVGTFYPPNLNSTDYISDASLGTYGGTFSAPAEQAAAGSPYGIYDYCSMPHPRPKEYQLPGPIKSGKVKGNLVYLEYMQRHQRRTAYNLLPGGEVCKRTLLSPLSRPTWMRCAVWADKK